MKINTQKIEEILTRGVETVIEKDSLEKKLKSGRQLRIKLGIDPTAPHLHLGNAVILLKLKEFQNLGHKIVLIIGDFTAQIGDPSGRIDTRKVLTKKEISYNMRTYQRQIAKILDLKKIDLVYNSWHLNKLSLAQIFRIFQFFSVNRLLEREAFQERRKRQEPIWLHEFLYPIFQAYDSVAVKADVEIGGSDQLFNLMMGRQLQPHFNQPPQDILTMRLLLGTDGKRKMSKSFGNYIAIEESPTEQYGKIMSIKDELIPDYLELCTQIPLKEVKKIIRDLENKKVNPLDVKARLAKEIVGIYQGKDKALFAEEEFERVFRKKELPSKIPEIRLKEKSINILELLVKTRLATSKAEAKRFILQKGVRINSQLQTDWQAVIEIKKEMVIQVGKRKIVKIV